MTSPGGNQDKVWLLSGDLFPLQRVLSETQSVVTLDAAAWALREMCASNNLSVPALPSPPLIVSQHYQNASKFVVLTPYVSISVVN